MSLHKLSKIIGFIFIIIGILGFIPGITEEGLLFGVFEVNAQHNFIYLLTGFIALIMSRKNQKITRYFFQIAGVVYLGIALLGFGHGDQPILGTIANNPADSWFNLIVSIVMLYIGFLYRNHRAK
ncbi:MAG: DUF4383 domain-containing protein [Rhabdochlamydiaceae bacterium]|nr:DUF4383 domain-containing protein [Rhabdochlamydiaceae bacterium]